MRSLTAAAVGGALGAAAGAALHQLPPDRRTVVAGRGLVVAAGVYLTGRRFQGSARQAVGREAGALAGTLGLAATASRLPAGWGSALLAAGWLAHAGFDVGHHRDEGSRVPDWYPPLCVGFDVVLAAALLTPGKRLNAYPTGAELRRTK